MKKNIKEFWEKVEHYNARLIPFAIVALLFVIVIELFFTEFAHHYHTSITILDGFIVAIFIVDLIFLALKAKSAKFFFKNYWLDIVAIIPFALIFTFINYLYEAIVATSRIATGQAILHESLEARKGALALSRSQRLAKYAKYIRIITRLIRVVTKSRLFTKLKHHTHRHPLPQDRHEKIEKIKRKNKNVLKTKRIIKTKK